MENTTPSDHIIHHDRKIGLITDDTVILYTSTSEQKIDLRFIKNVRLIKERVYGRNASFFLSSMLFFYLSYWFYFHQVVLTVFLVLMGVTVLYFSFFNKFYQYTLRIKDKYQATYNIKKCQKDKEDLKKFYYKIVKKTRPKE